VRCPHCQQIVIAPAATVPPAAAAGTGPTPAPAQDDPFRTLGVNPNDDIFTQRSETEDALFGQPEGPRLEIPREEPRLPATTTPAAPAPVVDLPLETTTVPASPPVAPENLAPTVSFSTSPVPLPTEGETAFAPAPPWESPVAPPTSPVETAPETPATQEQEAAATAPTVRKPRTSDADRINWFIPLVFLPLVLYAILATAAAGFLYLRLQSRPPSIWEQMPDLEGDNPGINEKRKKVATRLEWNRTKATAPLPAHLHVQLGETIRLGDLEVTPLNVQRKIVKIFVEEHGKTAEPLEHESLVLNMEMRNLSDEYSFTPLDNYFDRKVSGGEAALTVLVAGQMKFFGGPARWFPLQRDRSKREDREWVDLPGRKNNDTVGLQPGEAKKMAICTDGSDPAIMERLFGRKPYSGTFLWRVHVRRGLITYKGRQLPAAAVIGVEFTAKEVKKS
jgi:hypothetical protein